MAMKANIDIETSFDNKITVIGICFDNGKLIQLIGEDITPENLLNALNGAEIIYTYNGSRFDLPVIKKHLGINLEKIFNCHDLMYDCWECNLYGGLKSVEKHLGITRETEGIDGNDAMALWEDYVKNNNKQSLKILLEYNKEDVQNLIILRKKLREKI